MPICRPIRKAPVVAAPVYDWTGFYVGGFGGGGYGNHNLDNALGFCRRCKFHRQLLFAGRIGGGEVGYNVQSGRYLFGVEGDAFWSNIKGNDAFALGSNDATNLRWGGTLRARSGYHR